MPLVVRGAGTGYTGGAVPTRGGVVLSVERLNRILDIDPVNLSVVVEPAVITGDLQRAVEARGLYYPPDPASLEMSSLVIVHSSIGCVCQVPGKSAAKNETSARDASAATVAAQAIVDDEEAAQRAAAAHH